MLPGISIPGLCTDVDRTARRVSLSHKELLGTWEENAACLETGMTLPGYVRSIKDYGIFIELFPNLSGLAEPRDDLCEGDRVSVYIKSIFPDRHKIKLRVLERLPKEEAPPDLPYFHRRGKLTDWKYT